MNTTDKPKSPDTKHDNNPDFITFVVHTAKYRTLPTKKYLLRKKWVKKDEKKIFSIIPGVVHLINVKKGKRIKKDSILMELETMKMYNKIFSPFNGKIKEVYVKEKQNVKKDELLIEFE